MKFAYMIRRGIWAPLIALFFLTAGCGDLFDIENPGEILDEDLNDPDLIPILITGLSSDVSDFVDTGAFDVARISDEMAGSGSYADTGPFRVGWADQDYVAPVWEQAHEARWMAELHAERIQNMDVSASEAAPYLARNYLFAGIAHRALGENYCQVVYSEPEAADYGTLQPRSVAFQKAVESFNTAMSFASGDADFTAGAHAGLASAYVGLGQWDEAVQHAAQVPDDYEFLVFYDQNDNENIVYDETHNRHEMSAFGTYAATFATPGDPRAPWIDCREGGCPNELGTDGVTTHFRQEKYDNYGAEIVQLSGKEARLIEAEKALMDGNMNEFAAQINRVRDLYDLPHIDPPASAGALEYPNAFDDGWSILDGERFLTLWLEARRLWDLHRWDHPFLDGGTVAWPGEPRRDSCMPVPASECRVNPQFTCPEAAAGTIDGR